MQRRMSSAPVATADGGGSGSYGEAAGLPTTGLSAGETVASTASAVAVASSRAATVA